MNRFITFGQPLLNLKLIMIIAGLITVVGLPVSIILEFHNNNDWLLYFRLYPHLILFSLLSFGIVLINLHLALQQINRKTMLIRCVLIITIVSIFLTYIEMTSNNMMLFEFSNTAQSTIPEPQETIEQIRNIPNSIIDTNKIIARDTITVSKVEIEQALKNFKLQQNQLNQEEKRNYYKLMEIGLSYPTWEKNRKSFSFSRLFYISSFFIIVMASLMNWILLFLYSKQDVIDFNKYLRYLTIASLGLMTWIPLRYYYNLTTLNLLVGSNNAIGHFDVFAFVLHPIYFFVLCRKIYKAGKYWLWISFIIVFVSLLTIVGRFYPNLISNLFGINSNGITNLITWGACLLISIVIGLYQLDWLNLPRRINS
ncbi:MAG: hypothetical protein F6K61_12675 [Sphaerospermopsis sp. SIO1G1]|nr:hypothetical protein [Sphaerospermopsis sp. SIO1G1]